MKVFQRLSDLLKIVKEHNDQPAGPEAWFEIGVIVRNRLPRYSTILDGKESHPERIILSVKATHPPSDDVPTGVTYHKLKVTASLGNGLAFRITGRDVNGIKARLETEFRAALDAEA
jgi:hypothetical protein